MAILYEVNTAEVPLLLRLMVGEEDPAIVSARAAYQRHLEALQNKPTRSRIEALREKLKGRK